MLHNEESYSAVIINQAKIKLSDGDAIGAMELLRESFLSAEPKDMRALIVSLSSNFMTLSGNNYSLLEKCLRSMLSGDTNRNKADKEILLQIAQMHAIQQPLTSDDKTHLKNAISVFEEIQETCKSLSAYDEIETALQHMKCLQYYHPGDFAASKKRWEAVPKKHLYPDTKIDLNRALDNTEIKLHKIFGRFFPEMHLAGSALSYILYNELKTKNSNLQSTLSFMDLDYYSNFDKFPLSLTNEENHGDFLIKKLNRESAYNNQKFSVDHCLVMNNAESFNIGATPMEGLFYLVNRSPLKSLRRDISRLNPDDFIHTTDTVSGLCTLNIATGKVHNYNALTKHDLESNILRINGIAADELRRDPRLFFRIIMQISKKTFIPTPDLEQALRDFDFNNLPGYWHNNALRARVEKLLHTNTDERLKLLHHYGQLNNFYSWKECTQIAPRVVQAHLDIAAITDVFNKPLTINLIKTPIEVAEKDPKSIKKKKKTTASPSLAKEINTDKLIAKKILLETQANSPKSVGKPKKSVGNSKKDNAKNESLMDLDTLLFTMKKKNVIKQSSKLVAVSYIHDASRLLQKVQNIMTDFPVSDPDLKKDKNKFIANAMKVSMQAIKPHFEKLFILYTKAEETERRSIAMIIAETLHELVIQDEYLNEIYHDMPIIDSVSSSTWVDKNSFETVEELYQYMISAQVESKAHIEASEKSLLIIQRLSLLLSSISSLKFPETTIKKLEIELATRLIELCQEALKISPLGPMFHLHLYKAASFLNRDLKDSQQLTTMADLKHHYLLACDLKGKEETKRWTKGNENIYNETKKIFERISRAEIDQTNKPVKKR